MGLKEVAYLFLVFSGFVGFSQSEPVYKWNEVDKPPLLVIQNDTLELNEFVLQNIYWDDKMIEGQVIIVQYTIDKFGSMQLVSVVKSPESCEQCEIEFLKALKRVPEFYPAEKRGEKVSVSNSLLFHFDIPRAR